MIKCFVTLCMVGNASVCQPPQELTPADGHYITSPLECGRAGFMAYTAARIEQQTPEKVEEGKPAPVQWFPKVYGKQIGDGAGEIDKWLADQRAKADRLSPQIK